MTAIDLCSGPRAGRRLLARTLVEVAILAAGFVIYNVGRLAIRGQEATARDNADLVHSFQQAIDLPSEAAVQGLLSSAPQLFEWANRYYVSLHFPLAIAFLAWGFLRWSRADYLWARNLMVALTFLAVAIHLVFPLAPPRMFPEWGFVDTMSVWGPSAYDGSSAALVNQYAAMPSLHVGWALLIATVLARLASRPVAALAVVHAALTLVVVIVTANHWWLDAVVAAALLGLALVVLPRPGSRERSRGPGSRGPRAGATPAGTSSRGSRCR